MARRIDAAGVGDRIRLFPFSGSPDPHLAALDAFLLPSDVFESLPIGVLEAMAHSLPVIASDIGGLPELVQSGADGVLVPPGDPGRLADAIRDLAADPDQAAELGRRARDLVESRFSLGRMTNALEREYLEASAAP